MAHVVTCFVRERGKVLLTRRSDAVGTYRGRWAGVSGYVEEEADGVDSPDADYDSLDADSDPLDAERDARRELREEVGLTAEDLELVRTGEPVAVDDEQGSFVVHPFLFESDTREVTTNEELAEVEWVDPTAILERETVPRLWETWRRVAPTVETVREDRTHGSAWISARALEVLRDAAAEAGVRADEDGSAETANRADVLDVADDLRGARPEMAAVANRVNRVVARTLRARDDPERLVERAIEALEAAFEADSAAARTAATRLRDADATAVATLSRSGTVREAIAELTAGGDRPLSELVVAESRPECEGVAVAEWAARETNASVTLTTEAALPTALADRGVDAVVVGADSILPNGDVVNKTGTRVLALAARELDAPVYAVASKDKVRPAGEEEGDGTNDGEGDDAQADVPDVESPAENVYDGDADVSVHAPTFEVTPAALVDGIATEEGLLDPEEVRRIAERHAENAARVG
ncbi:NUDIX domain-containing protein [Halobellus limi]|uniref:NUDIX domain-containing protein n=1 Tax=Halobellus limi TaxID=699433 RepID=A0A1H5VV77_9EURY|nr:NUDIX domain-containing protein [Halobellus limi]QCC46625.1 NUDIX domain-containing protein [Halobellus limi]SEF90457.1 Translation initiation factor 2B subunit, eIF-2B alpha/beta/delta family [Halobellus limi]